MSATLVQAITPDATTGAIITDAIEESEWNKLERAEGLAIGSTRPRTDAEPYSGPRMGEWSTAPLPIAKRILGTKSGPPSAKELKAWDRLGLGSGPVACTIMGRGWADGPRQWEARARQLFDEARESIYSARSAKRTRDYRSHASDIDYQTRRIAERVANARKYHREARALMALVAAEGN